MTSLRTLKLVAWASVAAASAGLTACGGDSDRPATASTPPATALVPASASASVAGFISYLETLIASDADTLEPVDTSAVVPPTDDTAEPTSIS